jgi:hypothetical protein
MNTLNINLSRLLLTMCFIGLMSCSDKNDTIQPPGANPIAETESSGLQQSLPAVDMAMSKKLFTLATDKSIGDEVGVFEMRNDAILVHPGKTTSTRVTFKLSRAFQNITLRTYIAELPPEASIKEAGTVGVEFLLDGRSTGKLKVDRYSKQLNTLDLINTDTLIVVVDNDEGKPWFDWLMLGVVEMK